MSRDDIQKLLGGYATGTLTPEEQQTLFEAALDDQELFDALAREQSLRDLLRDPAAKAHLLTALNEKPRAGWLEWWRPAAIGLTMAAVASLTVILIRQPPPRPTTVAVSQPKPELPRSAPMESAPAASPPKIESPKAEPQRLAKEKAAVNEEQPADRRRAANAPRREVDQVAEVPKETAAFKDERADKPAAPQPAAAPAPPPPPSVEPPAPSELAAPKKAAPAGLAGYAAGVGGSQSAGARRATATSAQRQSARLMFLQSPSVDMVTKSFADAGQQGQVKQQSPAPPQQQQQLASGRDNVQSVGGLVATGAPGVRYTIAGSSLRLETNDYGYLFVLARAVDAPAWRTVFSGSAQPRSPVSTPALRPDEKEVFVSFFRTAEMLKAGPSPPQPGDDFSTNLVEKDGETTYVVNPLQGAAGRQVSFTIRLP